MVLSCAFAAVIGAIPLRAEDTPSPPPGGVEVVVVNELSPPEAIDPNATTGTVVVGSALELEQQMTSGSWDSVQVAVVITCSDHALDVSPVAFPKPLVTTV